MRRIVRTLALGMTALALLAGCVAIPTSGDVHLEVLDTDPEEIPNVALPEGPAAGQTPAELVQGFIRAGRAPQSNYNIARQYLAPDASSWSGIERVLVTSSPILPVAVDEDTVTVTVTVIGEVDARGVYTAREPQSQTLSYDFTLVDGEYRIARADAGSVLSRNGFEAAFEAYPLYFFDVSFQAYVTDLRWFPATRAVVDRIVDELLLGPAPWLAPPVAISAFPAGTEGKAENLAPRVEVDLSAAVRAESAEVQRRMIRQIEQSFAALGNITDIQITAGGLDLAPADAGDVSPEVQYPVREVIGGVDGVFGTLGTGGVSPIAEIGTRADALQPRGASLARDRRSVAVLGVDGVSIVPPSGAPVLVDARPGLLAPSLDRYGYAWTVPAGDPTGLRATGVDAVPHPLTLPVDGSVVSIDVSRDGARLLVALATTSGPRVVLLGIQRDAAGVPVGFGAPYALPVIEDVVDATWVDQSSVAVLRAGEEGTQIDVYPLGGPVRALGTVAGGVQIVGGNDVTGLRVLTADGALHRPVSAGGWITLDVTASFLGTQQ